MARLIDVDALLEEHCYVCSPRQREMCKVDPVCGSAIWIMEAPTVDAVPVVHGRWIVKEHPAPYGGYHLFHCSECDEPNARKRNYCSNCGAKMNLEVKDA